MEIIRYATEYNVARLKSNDIDIHEFLRLCEIKERDNTWKQKDDRAIIKVTISIKGKVNE